MTYVRFVPPSVDFDPSVLDAIEHWEACVLEQVVEVYRTVELRSPYNGYQRMLTPEGGILIQYRDLNLGLLLRSLRIGICLAVTGFGGWLILSADNLFSGPPLLATTGIGLINWLALCFKIKARHSVEIRPDAIIIDGEDVFYADDIGENRPELLDVPGKPDQMAVCAVVGTRFVQLTTANRMDENDRTPEVLIADLKLAIEQLWDRREVMFPTAR